MWTRRRQLRLGRKRMDENKRSKCAVEVDRGGKEPLSPSTLSGHHFFPFGIWLLFLQSSHFSLLYLSPFYLYRKKASLGSLLTWSATACVNATGQKVTSSGPCLIQFGVLSSIIPPLPNFQSTPPTSVCVCLGDSIRIKDLYSLPKVGVSAHNGTRKTRPLVD